MPRACSGAIGPVLSRILVVPVCYGPSRAVDSSNYIEIGQSSKRLLSPKSAFVTAFVKRQQLLSADQYEIVDVQRPEE
jgi:hypothetical protein